MRVAEAAPQAAKAWVYRADILERLRRKDEALSALREVIKLEPRDQQARLNQIVSDAITLIEVESPSHDHAAVQRSADAVTALLQARLGVQVE